MLIVCPSCASSYKIPDEKLGANGRTVRCKRCATTWFAKPDAADPETAEVDPFAAAVAAIDRAAESTEEIAARAAGEFTPPPVDEASFEADAAARADQADDASPDAFAKLDAPQIDMERVAPEIDGEVVAASARTEEEPAPSEDAAVVPAPPRRSLLARALALPGAGFAALGGLATRFRRAPAAEAELAPEPPAAGALSSAERLIPSRQDATARPAGPQRPSLGARIAPYAALAASCAAVVAVAAREPIGDAAPVMVKLYAAMGLGAAGADAAILNVTSEIAPGESGGDVLLVEGEIVNRKQARASTPALKVSVRDDRGVELYAWPAQSLKLSLEPGERTVFRARLASPPPSGRTVKVWFEPEAKGDPRHPRAL